MQPALALPPSSLPVARPTLVIGINACSVSFGEAQLDLRTRGSLRRILLAVAAQHAAAPGTSLTAEQVFEAGWPYERASAKAAAARVYTAVYTLRRFGLRGVLVRRDDGYMIEPSIVVVSESEQSVEPASVAS